MPKKRNNEIKEIKRNAGRNHYSRYIKNRDVNENIILYKINGGGNVTGAIFSFFCQLIEHPNHLERIHYIIVDDKKVYDQDKYQMLLKHPRVKLIKTGSLSYFKALASAKYIIYNNTLPTFVLKKEGQIFVNLWEETPLKKIGLHINTKLAGPIWNTQKNFYDCDYLVSPNSYTTKTLWSAYQLEEMYKGTVIEAGPLSSAMLHSVEEERLLKKLELELGCDLHEKKIVLYAPSARKSGKRFIDSHKVIISHVKKLKKELPKNYIVVAKVEATDYDAVARSKSIHLIPNHYVSSDFLPITHCLVTDYNNLFFDYLNVGKPVIFYPYDREVSEIDLEAYLSLETLPGPICKKIKEVAKNILNEKMELSEYQQAYHEYVDKYAPNNDGLVMERVVNIIFGGQKYDGQYTRIYKSDKKKILFHIGMLRDITERELCYSILRDVDYEMNTVVVDGNDIYPYYEEFTRINPRIVIVNSKFEKNKTYFEKKHLKDVEKLSDKSMKSLYEREFRSMYGNIEFDTIIDTVGKKTAWMNVFSGLSNIEKKLVFIQKNSLEEEKEYIKQYAPYIDKIKVVDGDPSLTNIGANVVTIPRTELGIQTLTHPLNVLFISAFDSTNYVFVNLIKELTNRGHNCTVVVKDKKDEINNKMYIQENISFIEISEYDMKLVNLVDFVFSAPLKYACYNTLYKRLNSANKFIITFASLFSSIVMGVNPDLALAIGTSKFDEFEENGLRYNLVAIGNPQYDKLIHMRENAQKKNLDEIKKVIIIEQGAYPYGAKGKTQLANVLCHIAKENPDISFTVKPRYLPSESGKQLHVLSEHLYDFIDDKPDNLILLEEATVLEDIILDYDAGITTWSTAYLDVALLGLPIILIDGLESIDVYNVRNHRINAAYDRLRHSGCVVHYEDLYDQPLPFRYVDEQYLGEEIYDPQSPCVPRVMELLEYLYRKLIVTDMRWKQIHQFTFDDLVQKSKEIPLIQVGSNEYRCRKRLFNQVNTILQKFIFENRCMGQVMDIASIKPYWTYEVRESTTSDEITAAIQSLKNTTSEIKDNFFQQHFDMVCSDRILQDYYFQWLFQNKEYSKILNYNDTLICPESLYFYKGLVLYKKSKYGQGTKYMAQFFEISANKECKDLRKDLNISAYLWKGRIGKYIILHRLMKYGAYEVITALDPQNTIYQRDIMLYYRVKSYMKQGLHDMAVTTCKEYNKNMLKMAKTKNLKLRIKYMIGKIFYQRTELLLQVAKEKSK